MVELIRDFAQYPFLTRALVGGLLISLCVALLGVSLVLRRFSMIGDGLSHVGFGALELAAVLNLSPLPVAIPVVILASFFMLWLNEKGKMHGDAAIALISSTALAIGIMLSYHSTAVNIDLNGYLFGSILGMTDSDVVLCIVLAAAVLCSYLFLYHHLFAITFDENFSRATGLRTTLCNGLLSLLTSVTVVIGMRLMGALLISSLIIFPALTAMRVAKSYRGVVLLSALTSVVSFLVGMMLILSFDLPVGASIVLVNLACFLLFCLIGAVKKRIRS